MTLPNTIETGVGEETLTGQETGRLYTSAVTQTKRETGRKTLTGQEAERDNSRSSAVVLARPNNRTTTIDSSKLHILTGYIDSNFLSIHSGATDSKSLKTKFGAMDSIYSSAIGRKSINTKFGTMDSNYSGATDRKLLNTEFGTMDSNYSSAIGRKPLNTEFDTMDSNYSGATDRKLLKTEFGTMDSNYSSAIGRKSLNTEFGTMDSNYSGATDRKLLNTEFGTIDFYFTSNIKTSRGSSVRNPCAALFRSVRCRLWLSNYSNKLDSPHIEKRDDFGLKSETGWPTVKIRDVKLLPGGRLLLADTDRVILLTTQHHHNHCHPLECRRHPYSLAVLDSTGTNHTVAVTLSGCPGIEIIEVIDLNLKVKRSLNTSREYSAVAALTYRTLAVGYAWRSPGIDIIDLDGRVLRQICSSLVPFFMDITEDGVLMCSTRDNTIARVQMDTGTVAFKKSDEEIRGMSEKKQEKGHNSKSFDQINLKLTQFEVHSSTTSQRNPRVDRCIFASATAAN
ncbi:hypothetical protein PoB_001961400 [Plakobranchus ocellatus]|uniref:Uncharacterized protein n=1 Tax=Plakobranchus ocellatus TaxID=259542 RepID=A0AAV3ZFH3_9GAST|nr:hypothetical protein PoB_001961400 [Plakobranchus ocellatus]